MGEAALPANLFSTDGNALSLWRDGKLEGEIVRLACDVESAGTKLRAPAGLERLWGDLLRWQPIAPTTPRALAALSGPAEDWHRLLFPEAGNNQFADGYAQAVTFGLLMARAQGITLAGLDPVARALSRTRHGDRQRVPTPSITSASMAREGL